MSTVNEFASADAARPGRVQSRVVGRPSTAGPVASGACDLQRLAGNAAVTQAIHRAREPDPMRRSSVPEVLSAPGRPLAAGLRAEMEARLGADLSTVRLHSGAAAQRSATEIGARAYTSGEHVVIGATGNDRHTLAHELTHVLQQRRGLVAGADRGDGLRISDPHDRDERAAEANAVAIMRTSAPEQRTGEEAGAAPEGSRERSHEHAVQRRIATPAKVGFEFQQLRSRISLSGEPDVVEEEPTDDGIGFDSRSSSPVASTDPSSAESELDDDAMIWVLKAPSYGEAKLWWITKDGQNLEFVTKAFAEVRELRTAMDEITQVARALLAPNEGIQVYRIGRRYLTVHASDANAQPQVNADVPLDSLLKLAELAGGATDQALLHQAYYYNVEGGPGRWTRQGTKEENELTRHVARRIANLSDKALAQAFGTIDVSTESMAGLKGLMQAMAAAVIHMQFYPGGIDKDQPLLLKTGMAKIWNELRDGEVIGSSMSQARVLTLFTSVIADPRLETRVLERVVRLVRDGQEPVMVNPLKPTRPVPIASQLDADPSGRRLQVLLEFRRVPILHSNDWTPFAQRAFDHFVLDEEGIFHQEL